MDVTTKEEIWYTKDQNVCNTAPSVVDCDKGKQLSIMLKLYSLRITCTNCNRLNGQPSFIELLLMTQIYTAYAYVVYAYK